MSRWIDKRCLVLERLAEQADFGGPVTVDEVMTPSPVVVPPTATVRELVQLFHTEEFRHPLVADVNGRLLGVVSDRDVLRCLNPLGPSVSKQLSAVTAADIMSVDVVTIEADATLRAAIAAMLEHGISCLPVVRRGVLVGILTASDLHMVLETLLELRERAQAVRSEALADWQPQD